MTLRDAAKCEKNSWGYKELARLDQKKSERVFCRGEGSWR